MTARNFDLRSVFSFLAWISIVFAASTQLISGGANAGFSLLASIAFFATPFVVRGLMFASRRAFWTLAALNFGGALLMTASLTLVEVGIGIQAMLIAKTGGLMLLLILFAMHSLASRSDFMHFVELAIPGVLGSMVLTIGIGRMLDYLQPPSVAIIMVVMFHPILVGYIVIMLNFTRRFSEFRERNAEPVVIRIPTMLSE